MLESLKGGDCLADEKAELFLEVDEDDVRCDDNVDLDDLLSTTEDWILHEKELETVDTERQYGLFVKWTSNLENDFPHAGQICLLVEVEEEDECLSRFDRRRDIVVDWINRLQNTLSGTINNYYQTMIIERILKLI